MVVIKKVQYTLVKIPIKELIDGDFNIKIDRDKEIQKEYLKIKLKRFLREESLFILMILKEDISL